MTPEHKKTQRKSWNRGRTGVYSEETKEKMSISKIGKRNPMFGKQFSKEHRQKLSLSATGKHKERLATYSAGFKSGKMNPMFGKPVSDERKKIASERHSGNKNYHWNGGLEFRKKNNDRRDSAYSGWRKQVWLRDNFKCKIANQDCKGRIEAHHILGWTEFVELRYEINNGITLCHAHHPRKRAEEKRLIPTFQELVSVSKISI